LREASIVNLFVLGLIAFFGIHVITVTPALRAVCARSFPARAWRGVVALVSFLGVGLICAGWQAASVAMLYVPSGALIRFAPYVMPLALVLIVMGGLGFKGYVRRHLHHPMLCGTLLWSAMHLAVNGQVRTSVLFGCFFVYSLYALAIVLSAGKRMIYVPALKWDVAGVALGVFIAIGIMHSHRLLFGVAVL
jgi:uncharacterized membrane protein